MAVLSITPVAVEIPTATTLAATVPTGIEWNMNLRVANNTAAAVTVAVWLVASGGSTSNANRVAAAVSIAPNDARYLLENVQLPPGHMIYLGASAASSLQAFIHGTMKAT